MRCAGVLVGLTLLVVGCDLTKQERLRAYNDDGIELFQKGDYRDARESFQEALKLKPDDPGLLFNRGECYDRLGAVAHAEPDYRACLKAVPNHGPCRHALIALLVKTHRDAEAQALVNDWITREPALAAAYAEDGYLLRMRGDLPRAQARIQQALDLDPHDERALTEMALTYEALNRNDRALALYEKILERKPAEAQVADRVNFLLAKGAKSPRPD
jgi:Tfp pilus assembly protein PilF